MNDEEREQKHWDILTKYLENATPEEQVQFARGTNYSNQKILDWMIEQKQTDVVAAMTIYFQWSPDFYAAKNLEEMDTHDLRKVSTLDLIADRVQKGFYTPSNIAFLGKDFLDINYDFKSAKREIPFHMQEEQKGSIILPFQETTGFDEGLPNYISKQIWDLFDTSS